MPTKLVYDCATGEQIEVEMTGAELAAHEALLAAPEPEPTSDAVGLIEMAATIDPGDNTAVAELSVLVQAFAAVAQSRGW